MADALTARQWQVLRFIANAIERGMPPTLREICKHFGWSCAHGARDHVVALEKKRMLERQARSARNIRITELGYRMLGRTPVAALLSKPSSQHLTEREREAFLAACGARP